MFELSIYFAKRKIRYVASFGHGSPQYGQTMWFSLTKEYMSNGGHVDYAEMLFPNKYKFWN